MPDQFNNLSNVKAHYETTGKEAYKQTSGEISHFVAGMGTTGTLMGSSMRLKEYDRDIQIIAVEPTPGHKIQGLKNMSESIVPGIYDESRLDEKHSVEDDDAFQTTRRLAVEEGIFIGMSSGAALWVALEKAKELKDGTIVVVLPDRGDRYLSTSLFTSVCAKCPPESAGTALPATRGGYMRETAPSALHSSRFVRNRTKAASESLSFFTSKLSIF